MNFKHILVGAVTAAALAGSAHAATLSSTNFRIDIYNFNAGGIMANADATATNVGSRTLTETVYYNGALDFRVANDGLPQATIGEFFATGSGTVTGLSAGTSALTLSSGGYQDTTFLDITAGFSAGFSGAIQHDDGISVFDDGVLLTAVSAQPPTTEISTPYSFGGGVIRLIYAAANGDPSVLEVGANVPLPASVFLLLGGLGGLGFVSRRRRAAAA